MYDALLIVSFGGPEGPDDVMPFLENVLRGRNVPRERMLEVAEHYQHFGGVSPINAQNRALIAALQQELRQAGPHLPIYWGNRNWHPLLTDTLQQMAQDGVQHALAFFTSAFSSYSGCRQYRENVHAGPSRSRPDAPQVDKLRVFYNHPGYVETLVERVRDAIVADSRRTSRHDASGLYRAQHSLWRMSQNCRYVEQLNECCRLISERLGWETWKLVYQSRSGPPQQPWLEPDICDYPDGIAGNHRLHGCRHRARRVYLGSYGSAVRLGHRGQAARRCSWVSTSFAPPRPARIHASSG